MSTPPSPHRRSRALWTAAAVLLCGGSLVACSASGSGSETAPTTAEAPEPTTEGGGDETTTTEGSPASETTTTTEAPSTELSRDEIDALLPTAAELGSGWTMQGGIVTPEESEATSALADAIDEHCPDLGEFTEERSPTARRASFVNAAGWDASVSINPEPTENYERTDEFLAAYDGCNLEFTNPANAADYEVSMAGQHADHYGDAGIMTLTEMYLYEDGVEVAEYDLYELSFLVGETSVTIAINSGADDDGNRVEPDLTLFDDLGAEMEMRLQVAQGLA